MCKVSIIVPVYNVEKYLSICLDSLIHQTLENIEIICINDGSTDNSLKIIEQYAKLDKRIKIVTKKNSGLSATRNNGIELAQGEYIGFCDSDDWVALDFYEKLYAAAKKYNADIAAANIIRKKNNKFQKFYVFNDTYLSEDYYEKIKICNVPEFNYVWNKIYKTGEFKNSNLKFISGLNYEDIAFTPQVLYYMKTLVTVPDTAYYYLCREGSIVHKKCNNADSEKAMKIALDFLKSKNIPIKEILPDVKILRLFGITLIRKTIRKPNPYATTKFDNK